MSKLPWGRTFGIVKPTPIAPVPADKLLAAIDRIVNGQCNMQICRELGIERPGLSQLRRVLTGKFDHVFGINNLIWLFRRGFSLVQVAAKCESMRAANAAYSRYQEMINTGC